jgi:hypothetical protein
MKRTRVSVVAAGASLALTATVMTIAPATAGSAGQGFKATGAETSSHALAAGRKKTKLKVKVDASSVVVLTPTAVTGKISGPKRKVQLQLKNAYGWRKVDADKSNKKGKFALKAPTKWYGKKKMRVVAAPVRGFGGKVKPVAVRVTEGYTPLGSKGSWSRLTPGKKTRYNPCQTIKYAVNPSNLPADGVGVLNEAVFRMELATGLRYKYSGATKAIPFLQRGKAYDKKANLAVAFTSPDVLNYLAGGTLAVGGYMRYAYVPKRKTYKLLKTGVAFDNTDVYDYRGFENGAALGAVVMHELTHATGLGHVPGDETQIMDPFVNPARPALFGAGDLTGLKKSGQDAGCLSSGNARVLPASDDFVLLP